MSAYERQVLAYRIEMAMLGRTAPKAAEVIMKLLEEKGLIK